MKFIVFLVFLTYLLSAANTYYLQSVEEFDEVSITQLEFDSIGNAYVVSINGWNLQIFKLNSSTDIVWTMNLTSGVEELLINSQNDVYMVLETATSTSTLNILREDTLTIEEIVDTISWSPIFFDEKDNLYYDGLDGIQLLRANSTTPTPIKNLEETFNYDGREPVATDSAGNVYFALTGPIGNDKSIGVVTNEAKQEEIPYATRFDLNDTVYVERIVADEKNDLWVFSFDLNNSYVQKISNGSMVDILTDEIFRVQFAKAAKDRIYVAPIYTGHVYTSGFYLTLNGEVEKIPELDNISGAYFTYSQCVADKNGNVYVGLYFPYEKGQVLIIRPESSNTWVEFPRPIRVRYMFLDENEDLWVVGDGEGIFYIKKGESTPNEVPIPPGVPSSFQGVNINRKSNEVFLFSFTGLYVIKNDSN